MIGLTTYVRRRRAAGVAGLGAAALALGGCADVRRAVSLSPVNPESPVAVPVGVASTHSYTVPRLSDVPPAPTNIPPAGAVKTQVLGMVRCRGGVTRFGLTHPPLSSGAEQFAADEHDVARVNPADIPPPNSAALSDAEAARLREVAAPPAALASGPAPTADQGKPPAPSAPAAARPARHAAARRPAPPSASPAPLAPVVPAAAPAAAAPVVAAASAAPPIPPPQTDPLLARCL